MGYQRLSLGHGIGLRPTHFPQLLAGPPRVAWLEAVSENYMAKGGRPVAALEKLRRDVPVALHGVSLSIGSCDPLNEPYLADLRKLVSRVEPAIVSDHLCWGSHGGRYGHDLWPLPQTSEAVDHVASRISRVQEVLQRQILIENVSSYVTWRDSEMPEWEFVRRIADKADCGILLDINNVYVSARNHGFDPIDYLDGIPPTRVGQLHLAGHLDKGIWLLDSHDAPVPEPVWALYGEALQRYGPVPALVEWDDRIPPLEALVAQSRKAAALEADRLARASS